MRVLAIDPGYERMGVAVLEKGPGERKERLLHSSCFKTDAKLPHHERLRLIGAELERVIAEFSPEALAIETLFFSNNAKTAMHVGEARGTILYVAAKNGLEVREFSPVDIKTSVSGYGRSGKQEMMKMIPLLVAVRQDIKYDDEYDAIAAGLAFFAHRRADELSKGGR